MFLFVMHVINIRSSNSRPFRHYDSCPLPFHPLILFLHHCYSSASHRVSSRRTEDTGMMMMMMFNIPRNCVI